MKTKLSRCLLAMFSGMLLTTVALRAETIDIPNLMTDAKVGDWVLYEMPAGITMKQSITEVTEEALTLSIETAMNGQVLSTIVQKLPRTKGEFTPPAAKDAPADLPKPVITKGKVTVKGQELECWIIETDFQGQKMRTTLAKGVPINGLVEAVSNGSVMLKLIDFGRK